MNYDYVYIGHSDKEEKDESHFNIKLSIPVSKEMAEKIEKDENLLRLVVEEMKRAIIQATIDIEEKHFLEGE